MANARDFTRRESTNQVLIVASLNNHRFENAYEIQTDPSMLSGNWREIFNSAAELYGGDNVGNYGDLVGVRDGRMAVRIPANGLLVFRAGLTIIQRRSRASSAPRCLCRNRRPV